MIMTGRCRFCNPSGVLNARGEDNLLQNEGLLVLKLLKAIDHSNLLHGAKALEVS
jgi:hypothetical protein